MGKLVILEPFKPAALIDHEGQVKLEDLYRLLECQTVDCRRLGEGVDMWVDDEGLLNDEVPANRQVAPDRVIAGTILICTHNKEGDSLPFGDAAAARVLAIVSEWPILPEGWPKPMPGFTVTMM